MTDRPPITSAARRRFIIRLLILDAICVPLCVGGLLGYSIGHIGWLLWLGVGAGMALSAGGFWLVLDMRRNPPR